MAVPDLEHPSVRRGRAARQTERLARHMETVPYLTRTLKPVEVISTEGLEQIEANADTLLASANIACPPFESYVDQVVDYVRDRVREKRERRDVEGAREEESDPLEER